MKRALPVVQKLIAAPCDVPWSSMKGDDRKRHCGECNRDVHNLSAMTKEEVQIFLQAIVSAPENATLPCINVYARQDGTILTQDCPVGLRARRRRALIASTLGLGGVAVAALTALVFLQHRAPQYVAAEPVAVHAPSALEPHPVVLNAPSIDTSTAPGFVTVEGPPGTVVFEGATRLGTAPLTFHATPGDHTYRASLQGKDEIFALTVGPNSCAMHRVALGVTPPVPTTSPTTTPHWRGRTAGAMRRPMTGKDVGL